MPGEEVEKIGKLSFKLTDCLVGPAGRFGKIYKGLYKNVVNVAIKKLDKERSQVVSDLYLKADDHPNIVHWYYTNDKEVDYTYLCTEICAGNLYDLFHGKYKGPDIGDCFSSLKQMISGLHYLHLLKIVHGDLKPTNILISYPKGDVGPNLKLSDFGLRHTHRKCAKNSKKKKFFPATTTGWMCPSDEVDEGTGEYLLSFDIFPLGCLFGFTALRGIHPFGWTTKHFKDQQPMTLTLQEVDISVRCSAFMDLLHKMLDYDASKRPTTEEILNDPFFKKQPVITVQRREQQQPLMPLVSPSQEINQTVPVAASVADDSCIQLDQVYEGGLETEIQIQLDEFGQFDGMEMSFLYERKRQLRSRESEANTSQQEPHSSSDQVKGTNGWTKCLPSLNASLPAEDYDVCVNEFKTTEDPRSQDSTPSKSPPKKKKIVRQAPPPQVEVESVEDPTRPYKCDTCNKRFKRSDVLNLHKKIHTGTKPHECQVCSKRFLRREHLNIHMNTHTGAKPFACPICPLRFSNSASLCRHRGIHSAPTFECEFCSKKFTNQRNLREHLKTHSESKLECEFCFQEFSQAHGLRKHLLTKHLPPAHECEYCHVKFGLISELKLHRDGTKTERPWCKIRRSQLEQENQAEQAPPPPSPPPLVSDFSEVAETIQDLPTFLSSDEDESLKEQVKDPTKPFECDVCSKRFKRKEHLTLHKNIHTGDKPFACDLCPQTFGHTASLGRHKLTHFKPSFECNLCPKKFTLLSTLKDHQKIHAEPTYICEFCEEKFTQPSGLRKHRVKKHSF